MAAITTAVVAGVGVVAGAVSAKKQADAAEDAAKGQQAAAAASQEEVQRQFDVTKEDLGSRLEAESAALEQQQALIGLSGQEAQSQALQELEVSPGQKFLRDRAQRNLLRNASAIGGLGGGNVRSALVQQGVGFAQQDIQNQFGRLGQIAGQGQAAVQLGQFGAQSIAQQGQLRQLSEEARASGLLGQQQAQAQGINQALTGAGLILGQFPASTPAAPASTPPPPTPVLSTSQIV